LRAELLTPTVAAAPGQPIVVRMEVVNTSAVIDEIWLDAPGLDPAWITGGERRAALFPDSRVELSARIDLPEHYPAGQHDLVVVVSSAVEPDVAVSDVVQVDVAPITRAELRLRPALVTAGRSARFRAVVSNQSNQPLTLSLDARDQLRVLGFDIEPRHLVVGPGEEAEAAVTASGPRPWFGSPLTRTVTVSAEGAAGAELTAAATFNQKARIPRGAVTAVTLAFILGVWVAAFTLGVNRVLANDALGKDRPEVFPLAQLDLDTAAVSGSLAGVVRAGTSGQPLPRITVEAYRNGRDGPEISASAATTEDGTFELAGLLPGSYLLRATAPGFVPTWYGGPGSTGAASPSAAAPTRVEASTATGDLALVIAGEPGSITGTVLVNALAGAQTTAQVTLVPVADEVRGEPIATVTTDPAGAFTFVDVPTPADYELLVSSEGFEDLPVPVSVRGGEDLVANTIRLAAGPGQMGGLVTGDKARPLGGVTVTVANGAFRVETTTPTSGQVGVWAVPDLPTPATYLVTFALEGYGTQTIALDLGPGQTRTDVNVTLAGGTGSLAGRVVDESGRPLGGVDVTVSGGPVKATTQTLTAGDVGSWRVLDLPTPGRYTITFTRAGHDSDTRVADLAASAGLDGIDVTLPRSVGSVSGTVTSGGSPRSGITVTVSNGSVERTTSSATSPAGAWLIANLEPGTWTVTFSGPGYEDQTALVTVGAGDDADVDADLVPG